jgi:Protein of unknown function (DUF2795)
MRAPPMTADPGRAARMAGAIGGSPVRMTNPIQLQKYLGGIDYPVDKGQLVEHAQSNGADNDTVQTLRNLPMDRFNSPNDVSEAVGKQNR